MKNAIAILSFILLFASCEKVIDVDLKDSEPVLVVDAMLYDSLGISRINLSYTKNFYQSADDSIVDDSQVSVFDSNNNEFVFSYSDSGVYLNNNFKAENNKDYTLKIIESGKEFTATSICPDPVRIDSLVFEESLIQRDENEKSYGVNVYFKDSIAIANFYRLRIKVNGKQEEGFFVGNDQFLDGKTITARFNGVVLIENDEVEVDLMGIDENNFDYFYALNRISSGGGNASTPGNPTGNIQGDAIGIFGAYSLNTFKVIFREDDVKSD